MNESLPNMPMLEHLSPEQQAEMAKMLSSPVSFARGVFGHDPWRGQVEILEAVMKHKSVAVKACHSSSKTFAAAELTLWWLCRYPDGCSMLGYKRQPQLDVQVSGVVTIEAIREVLERAFMPIRDDEAPEVIPIEQ